MNATPSHRPSRVVRVLRKLTDAKTSKTTIAAAISVAVAAWLSFGMLALSGDDARRRVGLLPPIWLLAALVVVAISAVKALRVSARTSHPLFLSWLIVPAWLPLPVPDVWLTWSGPAVVSVWTAIVFSVIAVARPRFGRLAFLFTSARTGAYTATALAFVAFLGVRVAALPPPTGDEPHYLVLTESLVHDGDVKVRNNYERADYLEYYGGYLRPHIPNPDDERQLYSLHSPGIAVIIAPAFAIAGYWAVVVWLAALTAIGTGLVWKIGCGRTNDIGAAWFGWAVVALTVPLALQATLVYPDSIAGVIMALGTFMLTRLEIPTSTAAPIGNPKTLQTVSQPRVFRQKSDTASVMKSRLCWALLGCGAAIAFLPWFHPRLAVPALILAAALLVRITSRSRGPMRVAHLAALVVPLAIGSGAWLAFSYAIYGSLDPRALYGGLSFSQLASGLPALLGDQEFGLLPNAPVHLVSFAGLWAAFKRDRRFGAELLLLVVPYIIVLGTWREWWGGSAPPARFLLPVMFPLGAAAANLWASQQQRDRTLSLTLLGTSLFVTAALAFGADGALAYNNATGRARWLDWMSPLVDLPSGFPSFFRGAPAGVVTRSIVTELDLPAVLWIFALLAGWMLFVVLDRRLQSGVVTPALLAPTCLAAIFMLGVSATWSVRSNSRLTATRAQLQLLRHFDPQYRPLGMQPFPPRRIRSDDLPARLALTTSAIDPSPAGMLLFLTEVPAGSYRLHASHKPHGRGTLVMNIGRGSVPAARWPLRAEEADTYDVYLPLTASTFSVRADEEAARAIELVKLIPTAIEPNTGSIFGRARDAARYGAATVYALDDRVWLEPDGFWLMGKQPAAVVIAPDKPVSSVELRLRNIPVPNRLHVETSDWREERVLAPNETWMIRLPMARQRARVIRFHVQNGVRPIDLDSANRDHRTLGSWAQLQDVGAAEER